MTPIVKFVNQLDPSLDRRRIIGEVSEIEDAVAQCETEGQEALAVLGGIIPKSKDARQFCMRVIGSVRFPDKANWYSKMIESLVVVKECANDIKGLLNTEFPAKLDTDSITYRQATMLSMLASLEDYTESFSRITTMLLDSEGAANGGVVIRQHPGERLVTQEAESKFLALLPWLFQYRGKFKQYLRDVPTTTVEKDDTEIVTAIGRNEWFGNANFISPWNPFYSYSKWRAECQADKYNKRKEQRRAQQLRLLELKGIQEQDGDTAVIQRQIELTNARINKLDARIKEFEEDYLQV